MASEGTKTKKKIVKKKTAKATTGAASSSTRVRKASAKKLTSVKKKTSTAKTTKVDTKKVADGKVSKKTPKKSLTKRTLPNSKNKKQQNEIILPERMSVRAQEKTLVLSERFERDFYKTAVTLSRVAGICFVAVGGVLSLSTLQHSTAEMCRSGCVAQASTAGTNLLQVSQQPASTDVNVRMLSTLPALITQTIALPIEVTAARDVSASLQFTDQNGKKSIIVLNVSNLENNKYSIEIRGEVLKPGQYTLKVEAQPQNTDRYKTFTLGSFSVASATFPLGTTASNSMASQHAIDPDAILQISSDQDIKQAEQDIQATPVFRISTPKSASGVISVNVNSTVTLGSVDFFVRPTSGINTQKVGQLEAGSSIFRLNTTNIPNGSYALFAKTQQTGTVTKTPSIPLEVFNRSTISTFGVSAEQERQLLTISRELNQDLYENFQSLESVDDSVVEVADERLRLDEKELDTLFTAYAAAQQTGDKAMVQAAKEAIDEYRRSVVKEALTNENDRYIADELDETLNKKLSHLESKVERFEAVRRERTENDSSIDTDGDGISDVDERVLYNTNPNSADSDGDGFTDGAEIVKGFNPRNSETEVIITYESPKEAIGVVKTDKLIVQEVLPDIVLETASSSERIHTVVRGRALPDSFVTLYVFSTPTIVTVRTDETGLFEYTFTKELEDGEHQVFAALTDNGGEIIAQSAPFSFIKEARAFTPVDIESASDELPFYSEVTTTNNSYRIVIGMAVLALGILLILLGLGLRNNKPEIVVTEK